MNQLEVEQFVTTLDNVQREENYGYAFFFVGEDHRVPFVSISDSDNDYDTVSNLNREGVFRINIGVSRETFDSLVGHSSAEKNRLFCSECFPTPSGVCETAFRLHSESGSRQCGNHQKADCRSPFHRICPPPTANKRQFRRVKSVDISHQTIG